MMSSNVSISDFEEHQFLVNSLQHTIHNSRPNTHVDTINNGYAACQQQTMQTNLAVMQGQGQDGMFEPSYGFATLSPRSSRMATGTTCLTDFGYLAADNTDHKQYNWLYDSMDAYMPTMANVENDLFVNSLLQQQDSVFTNEAIETAIGGMSYNSKMMTPESASANSQYSSIFSAQDHSENSTSPRRDRSFSSSETSNNSDVDSEMEEMHTTRQPNMFTAWRNPPTQDQKIFIKIKKSHSSGSMTTKSLGQRKLSRKSFTNLYVTSVNQAKNLSGKRNDKLRRKYESPPNSARSTSSLSSLTYASNALKISDSIGRDLSCHAASEEEEEDTPYVDDEDDEDDDDYRHTAATSTQTHSKKGRNVDKACNHCKRSHLRCDDMRPCKRCVSTGKNGCKDVEHKPRGRPKIHKK
ncbi:hypothetical protein INT43_005989 [Umbelopsis isabellina]|uniref:Zn(2)-C6 fungal-type domain-containing protein n=1 Tax=Mortierella isabellina TaxID=91625 RepID=A0A8H7PJ38_MORIS|nr:hypothetical protein INT43_005989 [Umbelopsis isabellina]